jgi:MFS transporter, DHA1 family, multidrug resistance protein
MGNASFRQLRRKRRAGKTYFMSNTIIGRLGRVEFIALVAAMIAINAFAIDIMLPGLEQIAKALGETDENRRQLVIPAYMLGFGVLQLVFGPLADRYGRKKPLLAGIAIYAIAALAANVVTSFEALVALRFLQGAGAAASAVIAIALVRDTFVGDEMAKIMSLVFMVMMVSPILAPSLGQFLMTIMEWRGLFAFMAGLGLIVMVWVTFRMPETLKPENQRPFTFASIIEGFGIVFGNRTSLSYIMATAVLFGSLMGYLSSSQQIYVDQFQQGALFPIFFGAAGIVSAVGGFVNAQAVSRFGMERLSRMSLLAYTCISILMLLTSWAGLMNVWLFFFFSCAIFFAFNGIMSNFGALAMAPLGEVAGTAASTQGFLQMVVGAAIGAVIGQLYDGTTVPLAAGFVVLSLLAGVIIWAGTKPMTAPHAPHR